jgi:hypothetical protein
MSRKGGNSSLLEESVPTCYKNVHFEVGVVDDKVRMECRIAVSVHALVWTRMQFAWKDGHDKTAA